MRISCPYVCTADVAFVEDCLEHANSQNTLISICANMVIDTSALVAILLDEPERYRFNQQIAADVVRLLSAATLVATAIVLISRSEESEAPSLCP